MSSLSSFSRCLLVVAAALCCVHSAVATTLTYNLPVTDTVSDSSTKLYYFANLNQQDVSTLQVTFDSYPYPSCTLYSRVGGQPSAGLYDHTTSTVTNLSNGKSRCALSLPSSSSGTYFLVQITGMGSSANINVVTVLVGTQGIELTMGVSYLRTISASVFGGNANDVYHVAVPSANDPEVVVKMKNWINDVDGVYVGTGYVPTAIHNDYVSTNDNNIDDNTYTTKLAESATCYILVAGAQGTYTIEASSSLVPAGVLVVIVLVLVLLLLVGCFFGIKKTWMKAIDTDDHLVTSNKACYCFIIPFAIGPLVFIIVGATVGSSVPTLQYIFIPMGCLWLTILMAFAGHKTYEMNAKTGLFTIHSYNFVFIHRRTTYNISEIDHFSMITVWGRKSITYKMTMTMTNGVTNSLEMGSSNIAVSWRQTLLTKLDAFVRRCTPNVQREPSVTGPVQGMRGVVTGVNPLQQQNVALQQALQQQQQQIAAMMQQQQQQQQPPGGGSGYPPAGGAPGYAQQQGGFAASSLPPPTTGGMMYTQPGIPPRALGAAGSLPMPTTSTAPTAPSAGTYGNYGNYSANTGGDGKGTTL